MTEVEMFLAKQQRYVCARLVANLTIEQCEQNRDRQANIHKGINSVMQCEGCTGLGKAIETKEQAMPTVRACEECNKVKKIHAYGHCAKCLYKKYGKSMKPPKENRSPSPSKQSKPAGPIKTPAVVSDKFIEPEKFQELLKKIDFVHTVTPSSNPLLPPAVECEVVLNFGGNKPLYDWLQEHEVTPDHIIELLDMAYNRGLKPVK